MVTKSAPKQLEQNTQESITEQAKSEVEQQRETELLTIANGLQSQVEYLTIEDGKLRAEIAQLRLWLDRVARPDADIPHLRSEMKKALDWL